VSPRELLAVVREACAWLGPQYASREADQLLLSIALQESGLLHRVQVGRGGHYLQKLARGWWMFEQGGVEGVMNHPATRIMAAELSDYCRVRFDLACIHDALAWHDMLAAGMARLNLWWLPKPLPGLHDAEEGWAQYAQAWRPGAPHPDRWAGNWAKARATVV
jgi:hypothetical protein